MRRAVWVTSTILLWVLGAGCQGRYQPAQARIQVTVFEAPARIVREYTLETRMRRVPDSSYFVSVISTEELHTMLTRQDSTTRMLYEDNRIVRDWPRAPDSWSYSLPRGDAGSDSGCSGGGAGFLGVRGRDDHLETRIRYIVNHRGPNGRKAVESNISFGSYFPVGRVLLFCAPSCLSQQPPQLHAIAFQVAQEDWTPPYDEAKRGVSTFSRPAFSSGRRSIIDIMQ